MNQLQITDSFPFRADSFHLNENRLIFYSGLNIYNDKHIASLPDPIRGLCSNSRFIFAITGTFLYQITFSGRILTKMRVTKKCYKIWCTDEFLIIGFNNVVEIWNFPLKFERTLYKLRKRIFCSSVPACASFYENLFCFGFTDNSVNIYCYETGMNYNVACFPVTIIAVCLTKNRLSVVTQECVYFYDIELSERISGHNLLKKETVKSIPRNQETPQDLIKNGSSPLTGTTYTFEEFRFGFNDKPDSLFVKNHSIVHKVIFDEIVSASFHNTGILALLMRKTEEPKMFLEIFKCLTHSKSIPLEDDSIYEIITKEDRICLKSQTSVQVFDETMTHRLGSILFSPYKTFFLFSNNLAACSDSLLNILKSNGKSVRNLILDTQTQIKYIFTSQKTLLTISSLGTVKMYDIANLYHFKTFDVSCQIMDACTNEDLSMLFIASSCIYIYDTKRGRIIDEFKDHTGPVLKIVNLGSHIYSLGMDNIIYKRDIYSTTASSNEIVFPEKTVVDFSIARKIVILCTKDISVYSLDFAYEKCVSIDKKMNFIPRSVAAQNEHIVFVYGTIRDSNYILVFDLTHAILISKFESGKITKLVANNKKVYALTENDLVCYGQTNMKFEPIDLEIDLDEVSVMGLIEKGDYLRALLGAIKLNRESLVDIIVSSCPTIEVESIIRSLPLKYANVIRPMLGNSDKTGIWSENIMKYHVESGDGVVINESLALNAESAKENMHIMNALARRLNIF